LKSAATGSTGLLAKPALKVAFARGFARVARVVRKKGTSLGDHLTLGDPVRIIVPVLLLTAVGAWIALLVVGARSGAVDIEARFVERIDYIPSNLTPSALLNFENFQRWLSDPALAAVRTNYAFPVLFPLDYIFLLSLGLFAGFGSVSVSRHLAFAHSIPVWIWWVFPILYMACDVLEDSILIALFTGQMNLNEHVFDLLRIVTKTKIATVSIAIGQLGFLAALWGLLHFYPTES
jgi:hypothetical protein